MTDFENIDFQRDIRGLNEAELETLAAELREFLVESVAKTGGHLASNLGVVELTLALHRAFDISKDKIVWDVGHQSYVHKILTGRAADFGGLRKYGGLSGFPKTGEHLSDVYNSGHASSSISAAMGLAEAAKLAGESSGDNGSNAPANANVVCVIGDGSLTGGLAYEGLCNAGAKGTKLLVVLNDNEMAISRNEAGIAAHLSKLRSSERYLRAKQGVRKRLTKTRAGEKLFRGAEILKDAARYAIVPGSLFEELGFTYFGPIDGHNIAEMTRLFEATKNIDGPALVHVVTQKGKGYPLAEQNPEGFHGTPPFNPQTGEKLAAAKKTWSEFAGDAILELAEADARVCAVCAAMGDAVGLNNFAARFPERFYDAGIAEAHAAVFSAGLALGSKRPFVFIYSTFLQRAYDEILLDVCAQNLPVVFMLDRAGNVGGDGETHHGVFDLAYLSKMPNMTVMAPKDGAELCRMMRAALFYERPVAIRYPRGATMELSGEYGQGPAISYGESERLTRGTLVEIRAVGKMAAIAVIAAKLLEEAEISCGVINERFVAPLDLNGENGLLSAAKRARLLVTLEDGVAAGGFGEAVAAALMSLSQGERKPEFLSIAWPNEFLPQGEMDELFAAYELDAPGIAKRIANKLVEMGAAGEE